MKSMEIFRKCNPVWGSRKAARDLSSFVFVLYQASFAYIFVTKDTRWLFFMSRHCALLPPGRKGRASVTEFISFLLRK